MAQIWYITSEIRQHMWLPSMVFARWVKGWKWPWLICSLTAKLSTKRWWQTNKDIKAVLFEKLEQLWWSHGKDANWLHNQTCPFEGSYKTSFMYTMPKLTSNMHIHRRYDLAFTSKNKHKKPLRYEQERRWAEFVNHMGQNTDLGWMILLVRQRCLAKSIANTHLGIL